MDDDDERAEAERGMREAAEQEVRENDPVAQRFVRHHFISRSHGSSRGRNAPRRKQPLKKRQFNEVDLIADLADPRKPPAFKTKGKFPFDTKATEVYNDPDADSDKLREDIDRL